jgi:acetyl-CoA synthetase
VTNTTINEVFGTAETGWIIGRSRKWVDSAEYGCRVVPGRSVEIIDEHGNALPPGMFGRIAIHKSDPGLFTGYEGEPAEFSISDWVLIGMCGYKTEKGFITLKL